MKTIKVFLITVVLAVSNVMYATNRNEDNRPLDESISEEIQKILKNASIEFNEEVSAKVYFTLNNKNEIVILSVESDSEQLEYFLKHKLNYYKLNTQGLYPGKKYLIPIKLVA
ncbi:hypothetical protein [Aestuariibaculum sediminum]|uniref:Uncharacterized protein n=1 Tax=Aestuariibaculum sediminum TaxID=2770637 RepID=A0A8J6U8S5_9FLAO|nr:hypothetical protein [Aestuariibaculum sediminum]MBD0832067.1 hypothetical protein [Aestuariibaculum sediminum]